MRTESATTPQVATPVSVDEHSRLHWLPWALVPVLGAVYWLLESYLHTAIFDGGSFANDLFSPPPHELWMRGVVIAMLLCLAGVSSIALRKRNRRIAQLTLYQERLREMMIRLAEGDDDERRQLGERLHEHVAQTLTAAGLYLSSVEDSDPATTAVMRSAERIIGRAIIDCREIATALSPPVLREFGLVPAVQELGRRISRRTGIDVETKADTELGLQPHMAELSFRAISDVVLVAVSDPRTMRVRVTLEDEGAQIVIAVEWDAPCSDDFFEIRERVSIAGGRFSAEGLPDKTRVVAWVPVGDLP